MNFFVADVRTGVGPFVAIYLAKNHWTPVQIGVSLAAAELAGVLTQAPGGALVDRLRSKRALMIVALCVLSVCALLIARFPQPGIVDTAQVLLGMTGSIFGPGISAITLGLVGHAVLGARTGRNASFGSAGNLIAAVTMGLIGYYDSTRTIFYFVALLSVPTIFAVLGIRGDEIDFERARGGTSGKSVAGGISGLKKLFSDKRIGIFAAMTILFHTANGAMLASMGEIVSAKAIRSSDLWMGSFVTVPQIVMALIGATVGKMADKYGRKPVLLAGFVFLPIRAILASVSQNPEWLTAVQVLDGISAGVFGIVGVLMIADCTEGTGHYNLALGTMGAAVGIGASISTVVAGVAVQHSGFKLAFLALGAFGVLSTLILWLKMPETRPVSPRSPTPVIPAHARQASATRQTWFKAVNFNFGFISRPGRVVRSHGRARLRSGKES